MNILFLNPPWFKGDRVGVRAGSRWPYTVEELVEGSTIPFPFFLAYSAALLRENGFGVEMIDGIASWMSLDQFFAELRTKDPDLIVLETSTPSYEYDVKITEGIGKELPGAKIAFSGTHASVFPEEVLSNNPFIDYVLIGEYEYTVLELVQKLDRGENLSNIKGLALRENGEIRVNERRPLIDLDQLPYPARDLTPIYHYNDCFCKHQPNVQLHTSRGCVFSCSFCAWPKIMYGGTNYRLRSAARVVDEIEFLLENYSFEEFYIDDDTFNIRKEHVENLCEEIEKRKLKIIWSFMGHTGNMTNEFLEKLRQSGCEGIKFGVETGDEEILKSLHKGTTLEQTRNVFRWCKEVGVRTHATFTFGLPGETKKTIKKTIDFLLELDPDSIQVSLATPLPGTSLYQEAKEKGWLLTENWSEYDGSYTAVMKTDILSERDVEKAYQQAWDRWRIHQLKKQIKENKLEYFKKGIRNPVKAMAAICKIYKRRG